MSTRLAKSVDLCRLLVTPKRTARDFLPPQAEDLLSRDGILSYENLSLFVYFAVSVALLASVIASVSLLRELRALGIDLEAAGGSGTQARERTSPRTGAPQRTARQ